MNHLFVIFGLLSVIEIRAVPFDDIKDLKTDLVEPFSYTGLEGNCDCVPTDNMKFHIKLTQNVPSPSLIEDEDPPKPCTYELCGSLECSGNCNEGWNKYEYVQNEQTVCVKCCNTTNHEYDLSYNDNGPICRIKE